MIARIAEEFPEQALMNSLAPTRLVLASLVAPLIPMLLLLAVIIVLSSAQQPTGLGIFGFGLIFSYFGLILFGLPCFLLLRRMRWLSLGPLILAGALGGILLVVVALQLLGLALNSCAPNELLQIAWGAGFGVAAALPFGLIAGVPVRSAG